MWNEEEFCADLGVRSMRHIQRWMYKSLLQSAFFCSTRPHLPDNDSLLWMLAGCEHREEWEVHKKPVRAMFTKAMIEGKKVLSQKRLASDWDYLTKRREAMAEKGKKGGQAKAKRRLSATVTQRLADSEVSKGSESESELVEENVPSGVFDADTYAGRTEHKRRA